MKKGEVDNYDIAVIGGGVAGMSTAARLQAEGLKTIVLEAHGQIGGCAGYFRKKGFAFDVGATTLVDFQDNGVGGQLLRKMDFKPEIEQLPGYKAWLPDQEVILHSNHIKWEMERLNKLGNSESHKNFWKLLDKLASAFWKLSRQGVKLPIQSPNDVGKVIRTLGFKNLSLVKYLFWTMEDCLRKFGLENDKPLRGLLAMLIEDTVHSTIEEAPLINASLGITIRGAGLSRARGGMYGFWEAFSKKYKELGGVIKRGYRVLSIHEVEDSKYFIQTNKANYLSKIVVSGVPIQITEKIAPEKIQNKLGGYLKRDNKSLGGAIVMFIGVPECEVDTQEMTHHQLMYSYDKKFGNGNNMFISVSSPGDTLSAPDGYRAVMISTHCDLEDWENLTEKEYCDKKAKISSFLLDQARRVYPKLGNNAEILEIGTPRTYEKFTFRPRGAVGGVRQTLKNSNLHAVPHWFDNSGFYQVGDTTWPGLGTVAGVLGSKIVADQVISDFISDKKTNNSVITTKKFVNPSITTA